MDLMNYVEKSMDVIISGDDDFADPEPYGVSVESTSEISVGDIIHYEGSHVLVTDLKQVGEQIVFSGFNIEDEVEIEDANLPDTVERLHLAPGDEMLAILKLTEDETKSYEVEELQIKTALPGPCSLNFHPGASNWVERAGGLPNYMCQVASALIRKGIPPKIAIPMGIGIVKNWAQGKQHVHASTRARALAAVAEWEAKKALAKANPAISGRGMGDDYGKVGHAGYVPGKPLILTPAPPGPSFGPIV